ncbi:hypothetical protein Lalb_Chr06g0172891 [Lupinus albus]|uniref:Uncharacterized protein n=1 Tax=Lupinus albus TaxID=3870 RepID=A0A6A4QF12_LUPAL|nr:hypothetical protein Lalb_Chr06g0172891 [Lupinus albus]
MLPILFFLLLNLSSLMPESSLFLIYLLFLISFLFYQNPLFPLFFFVMFSFSFLSPKASHHKELHMSFNYKLVPIFNLFNKYSS